MRYCGFEYDGQLLSDYGFIVCDFDKSGGVESISAGSEITFNRVSRHSGKIHSLVGTKYDSCITSSFSICKDPNVYENLSISNREMRQIMRWLNRREFLKFAPVKSVFGDVVGCRYYNASFNVSKVIIGGVLYGFNLEMYTNSPFGYERDYTKTWDITDVSTSYIIDDPSDEIGYIYPSIVVKCRAAGDLSISNTYDDTTMTIKNVSAGEIITVEGSAFILSSSIASHKLYDDFNFEFLKIGNTFDSNRNVISVSIPCELTITYCPIVKDSPD